MTHAPRNGEGEKLAEETILLETAPPPPLPESIETHEDSYSEFWVRRAQNTYFFFPVGTLVQSAMTAFSGRILGCREALQPQFQARARSQTPS